MAVRYNLSSKEANFLSLERQISSELQRKQPAPMTPTQQKFLFWCFIREFLFWAAFGIVFIVVLYQSSLLWSLGVFAVLVFILARTVYDYSRELQGKVEPQEYTGPIYKTNGKRGKRISIADAGDLYARRKDWKEMVDGARYAVLYTPKSKWLLDYHRLEETSKPAAE
jgi:hypothetical protein